MTEKAAVDARCENMSSKLGQLIARYKVRVLCLKLRLAFASLCDAKVVQWQVVDRRCGSYVMANFQARGGIRLHCSCFQVQIVLQT